MKLRPTLCVAATLVIGAGGLSGCAASAPRMTLAPPAAVEPLFDDHRAHGSEYVTIIDSTTIRNALRKIRSTPSANLTLGQKAAVLSGSIVLVLLLVDAMSSVDDLSGHIDEPTFE